MKDHMYWQQQLNSFVDKELGPADHAALEKHLETCKDCFAQAEFLKMMKRRLKMHRNLVQMPDTVKSRILNELENHSKRRSLLPFLSMAAAILVFGVLIFSGVGNALTHKMLYFFPGREVVHASLRGTVICPDCQIAEEIGSKHGAFCSNGCVPGLLDKDGHIWRIARDQKGVEFGKHLEGLFGKQVVLSGDLIFSAHLVRMDGVQTLTDSLLGDATDTPTNNEASLFKVRNQSNLVARVF